MPPTIWIIVMFVFAGVFIVCATMGVAEWVRNNKQPQRSTEARIVAIDDRDSKEFVKTGGRYSYNLTRHYLVAFELLSTGAKINVRVPVSKLEFPFSMVKERDTGTLTLKGTRYISFRVSNLVD